MNLRLDWASHEAAKYACENWHYTKSMPSAGVKIGVWEDNEFIGVVLYGVGAGNVTNGKQYGLARSHEMAELMRVALRDHKTPVSKIIKISLKMLKKQSPGLRLIVSFADEMFAGHIGGIYQAGNWVYTGTFQGDCGYLIKGKRVHNKTVHSNGWKQNLEWLKKHIDPKCTELKTLKHRYLMPLDDQIRLRIQPLSKPYPKRPKEHEPDTLGSSGRCDSDPDAPTFNQS